MPPMRTNSVDAVNGVCEECGAALVLAPLDNLDYEASYEYVCPKCGLVHSKPMSRYEALNLHTVKNLPIPKPPNCICGQNELYTYNLHDSILAICKKCKYSFKYYYDTGRWSDMNKGKITRKPIK